VSSRSGKHRLDWILSPDPALESCGSGSGLTLGVLALQGDFREHRVMLERLGARTREVRHPLDLVGLDGLVLPGGESTTISKLIDAYGLAAPIRAFAATGHAVLGTCAGLITVARGTVEGTPPTLGLMDVIARRNAFGRQVRSFEADLTVAGMGERPLRAVFIRAPWIESAGPAVEVLATVDGHIVAAREGIVLVTAFHPELTDDTRFHELFVSMIRRPQGETQGSAGATAPGTVRESRRVAPVNC